MEPAPSADWPPLIRQREPCGCSPASRRGAGRSTRRASQSRWRPDSLRPLGCWPPGGPSRSRPKPSTVRRRRPPSIRLRCASSQPPRCAAAGLGADAGNEEAIRAIYTAKGRPSDNPLIVHVASAEQAAALVAGELPPAAAVLMAALWPGPLTLVLPLKPGAVCTTVTAGLDTVAVRMPEHPVAIALIRGAGGPGIAAPSANTSGRPSPSVAAATAACCLLPAACCLLPAACCLHPAAAATLPGFMLALCEASV